MWQQALVFCGGLIYAAVDDLRTRKVQDAVCLVIALAGLAMFSPASALPGAVLAALPFLVCSLLGRMGGGDWRLAAAAGFVLGAHRALAGLCLMLPPLVLCLTACRFIPKLRERAGDKLPMVPFIAAGFIPAYFIAL